MCWLLEAKTNGEANKLDDSQEKGEDEGAVKLKNQSVLQTKLTKLAIQIGYAGKIPRSVVALPAYLGYACIAGLWN